MEILGKQNLKNTLSQRVQDVIARTKKLDVQIDQSLGEKQALLPSVQKSSYALTCQSLWPFSMKRTLQQNACMWALLADISRQLNWQGMHLSKSEWKDRFVTYMEQLHHVRLPTGRSTSCMSVEQIRLFIGLIVHFGLTHGVEFNFSAADQLIRQDKRRAAA